MLVRSDAPADNAAESVAFDVRPYLGEQLDVSARPDVLTRVSRDSGGERLEAIDSASLPKMFEEYMQRSRPPRIQRATAWDRWWVLAGIVVLWTSTWAIRRRGGVV